VVAIGVAHVGGEEAARRDLAPLRALRGGGSSRPRTGGTRADVFRLNANIPPSA
jgi:hypothetical protein